MFKKFISSAFLFIAINSHLITAMNNNNNNVLADARYQAAYDIICGLLHVPSILTIESKDPVVTRNASIPAMLSTLSKTFSTLGRISNNERVLKIALWDVLLKNGTYSAAALYDIANVFNAEARTASKHEKDIDLALLKKSQSTYLLVEMLLRLMSVAVDLRPYADVPNNNVSMLSSFINDVADCIEIWRLLSRYATNTAIPGVDITIQVDIKHPDTVPEELLAEDSINSKNDNDASDDLVEHSENAAFTANE